MKTQEELNTLKQEYEILTNKLKELTEDELKQIYGGFDNTSNDPDYGINIYPDIDLNDKY